MTAGQPPAAGVPPEVIPEVGMDVKIIAGRSLIAEMTLLGDIGQVADEAARLIEEKTFGDAPSNPDVRAAVRDALSACRRLSDVVGTTSWALRSTVR